MGADALDADAGEFAQCVKGGGEIFGNESAAAHAGIDGEVNGEHGILRRGDLMEMAGFFERGNAGHPVMAYNFLAFLGPGCPEQIDGSGDASLGDAASFTNVGYTEKGDFFGSKNSGNIFEAMTVGSGFDNGHQGHVRPGLSGDAKIVT